MMKRNAVVLVAVCLFSAASVGVAVAQQVAEAAGTWNVTLSWPPLTPEERAAHARGVTPSITEQWIIRQNGSKITGTLKGPEGEKSLEGTLRGQTIRGDVIAGGQRRTVFLTVSGDQIYGTLATVAVECVSSEGGTIKTAKAGRCVLPGEVKRGESAPTVKLALVNGKLSK